VALDDDMLCGLGILEIRVNLNGASEEDEYMEEVEVDSHHPNSESNVEYTKARPWHPFQEELGSFTHCNYNNMSIIEPERN
jgi:hypothetical protein